MTLPEDAVILLAEDLVDHVLLIRRALEKADIKNPLFVVRDGEEALEYLYGEGKYSNRHEHPLPDLLLLDLKMPKMDGFEVLRIVRSDRRFATLRVIVLTSSEDIYDVNKAYELGANSFLVKPLDFENFTSMMRTLSVFWLQQSKAPRIERHPKESSGNGCHPAGK
jgi:CheY-like chemotaxis protein